MDGEESEDKFTNVGLNIFYGIKDDDIEKQIKLETRVIDNKPEKQRAMDNILDTIKQRDLSGCKIHNLEQTVVNNKKLIEKLNNVA